jgi:hypothetical protein
MGEARRKSAEGQSRRLDSPRDTSDQHARAEMPIHHL